MEHDLENENRQTRGGGAGLYGGVGVGGGDHKGIVAGRGVGGGGKLGDENRGAWAGFLQQPKVNRGETDAKISIYQK